MVSNITDTDSEARLIRDLKSGKEQAFRMLIQQYQGKLYRLACSITLDRAESEDIIQDVFLKAFENIKDFKEDASLATWLHRITVNHCLNWKRTWKRRFKSFHRSIDNYDDEGGPLEIGTDETAADRLFSDKETGKIVWDALKRLPDDARTVFVLKEVEGLSYDEIAASMNIKRGTVSSKLFYARKRLQKVLSRQLENET